MKLDEFAFFNQQLAAMLRDGIPLESALGQLCSSMRRGDLRDELEKLRADLANGVPIQQALAARKLPPFYVQMIQIGVKSNNLPGVLTLVADYYQRANLIGMRLKGLMIYPLIVLVSSLALSIWLTVFVIRFVGIFMEDLDWTGQIPVPVLLMLWVPLVLLVAVTVLFVVMLTLPSTRRWLSWRVPAFREASVARVGSVLAVLLRGGCTLPDAIGLLRQMETGTPAEAELTAWQSRLASGQTTFTQIAGGGKVFPGMFVWLVDNARENLAQGFERATEVYQNRAVYRSDVMLYAALPVAVIVLGTLICGQLYSMSLILARVISSIGM
jgi:type II secretory pathway component PulF